MQILSGYKTLLVFGLSLLTYIFGWDQLTQYVSPHTIAVASSVLAIAMRVVTTTPVLSGTPPPAVTPKP